MPFIDGLFRIFLGELDSDLSTVEEEKNLFAVDMVLFHEPGLNSQWQKIYSESYLLSEQNYFK